MIAIELLCSRRTTRPYLQYVQSRWGLRTPNMLRADYPTLHAWRGGTILSRLKTSRLPHVIRDSNWVFRNVLYDKCLLVTTDSCLTLLSKPLCPCCRSSLPLLNIVLMNVTRFIQYVSHLDRVMRRTSMLKVCIFPTSLTTWGGIFKRINCVFFFFSCIWSNRYVNRVKTNFW